MKRRILTAVIAVMMFCGSMSTTSYAEERAFVDDAVEWNIVRQDCTSDFTISDSSATCTSRVYGDDVKNIAATQTLQKKSGTSWKTVTGASWSKTSSLCFLSMSNSKSGLTSGTYRLKTTIKCTNTSGQTETITVYRTEEKILTLNIIIGE